MISQSRSSHIHTLESDESRLHQPNIWHRFLSPESIRLHKIVILVRFGSSLSASVFDSDSNSSEWQMKFTSWCGFPHIQLFDSTATLLIRNFPAGWRGKRVQSRGKLSSTRRRLHSNKLTSIPVTRKMRNSAGIHRRCRRAFMNQYQRRFSFCFFWLLPSVINVC